MKKSLKMENSVYSSSEFSGLNIRNGKLINNRPDGQTGIAQASQIRKAMKNAEKISVIARGTAMGEMMDMDCGM